MGIFLLLAEEERQVTLMEAAKESSAVTVENIIKALECDVCTLPLKPPVFQSIYGRVTVCSSCKHNDTTNHLNPMKRLVSVPVPCTHAAHGCAAKLAPDDLRSHGETCPYAPFSCPAKGCGFVGNVLALLEHVSCMHTRVEAVQQFWEQDLSNAMAKLRVNVAAAEENDAWMPVRDIDLVMSQARVTRPTAVKALKENDGDIVCALIGLMD